MKVIILLILIILVNKNSFSKAGEVPRLFRKGKWYMRVKAFEKAIPYWEKLIKIAKTWENKARAKYQLLKCYINLYKWVKAGEIANQLKTTYPYEIEIYFFNEEKIKKLQELKKKNN
jgi:tetratricopeptide (TPR) repeat protein